MAAALLLAACAVSGTPTVAPSATAVTSTATPAAPRETPSPDSSVGLEPNAFASVTVNGLTVRSGPDVAAETVSCFGPDDAGDHAAVRLDADEVVFIVADPPVTDGDHAWHRVVAPADDGVTQIGTACDDVPLVTGWVASPNSGDPWLSPSVDCPAEPRGVAELAQAADDPMRALACLGAQPVAIRASFVPPPEDGIGFSCPGIDPGWLTCGITRITDGTVQVTVRAPEQALPRPGTIVGVTLRFDDPAAAECQSLAGDRYDPLAIRIFCRTQLVMIELGS